MEDWREEVVPAHEFEQPEPRRKHTNERKHLRLQAKGMKACIRVAGREDDIVDVINYSRGGLRFASFTSYEPGNNLEIATDYSPTAVCIFQRARIVGMYQRAWGTFAGEYGVQFLK
jgi:hypothetical protein